MADDIFDFHGLRKLNDKVYDEIKPDGTFMTINETIKFYEEKASELEMEAFKINYKANEITELGKMCHECAKEHKQIAEWLKQLRQYQEASKSLYECITDLRVNSHSQDTRAAYYKCLELIGIYLLEI